jgi:glutamate synthase (NADPH/NADH) small chain
MANQNFEQLQQDLHPPLSRHEASVESDRCYFCYDAPCVTACPTGIDIPLFIRQISTDNPKGRSDCVSSSLSFKFRISSSSLL